MSQPNPNEKLEQPLRALAYVKDAIMGEGFIGGPSPVKLSHVINLFKAGTLPFCLWLMSRYNNWSPTMAAYAGLHGAYGLVWLLKEYVAPDAGWNKWVTIPTALTVALFPLGAYWLTPYLIASAPEDAVPPEPARDVAASVRVLAGVLFGVGVALLIGSDVQKHFVLRARPGLITDGFFALCRHPNYLGEIMIYSSFAVLGGARWQPWAVLAPVWGIVFLIQMKQKEARMSRHAAWGEYAKKTAFLIPFLF
jgi:protein-S-isoprenylcysteine O-methyltransferase Ste14